MLESFSLVGKRALLQNRVDWDHHAVITMRAQPFGFYLNAEKLKELSSEEQVKLFSEIITYLYE